MTPKTKEEDNHSGKMEVCAWCKYNSENLKKEGYSQAQKEELEFLENVKNTNYSEDSDEEVDDLLKERIAKLKHNCPHGLAVKDKGVRNKFLDEGSNPSVDSQSEQADISEETLVSEKGCSYGDVCKAERGIKEKGCSCKGCGEKMGFPFKSDVICGEKSKFTNLTIVHDKCVCPSCKVQKEK